MLAEIIRINAETFDAWTLLSTVFEEQGNRRAALMCLVAAAHLTPKVGRMWINAATYALDGVDVMPEGADRDALLQTAMQCYSAAVRANPADVAARTGKADVLMSLGQATLAVSQYRRALKHRPLNIRTVRNLADVALDARDPRQSSGAAKEAYRHVIDHCQQRGSTALEEGHFEWSDLRIYLEFFAMLEEWTQAAAELSEVARWLLGRRDESIWSEHTGDDREWDLNDDRRVILSGYEPARFPLESYGGGLPVDLRARLCLYRLKLGQEYEAMVHIRLPLLSRVYANVELLQLHLEILDPQDRHVQETPATERFRDFPDCLKDVGLALLEIGRAREAVDYFELYRKMAAENDDIVVDADLLVNLGRCYLVMNDRAAAEECFLAAIEEEDDNIEARFELAKIYEDEQEKEGRQEAFLLINEALDLEAQGQGEHAAPTGKKRPRKSHDPSHTPATRRKRTSHRPRRLGGSEERKRYEEQRTATLLDKYRQCQQLKSQVAQGDENAMRSWMAAAKELTDDFRASKEFYPWDMYIRARGFITYSAGESVPQHVNANLAAMAARLEQSKAPCDIFYQYELVY
jgi:general transcription factor 3C polypeptide 3 (transcription factor C subunit 4)